MLLACNYVYNRATACLGTLSAPEVEMVMSDYAKRRVLSLHNSGFKVSHTAETLVLEDGIRISKQGIRKFLLRYSERGTIARKPGSGFTPKLLPEIKQLIDTKMHADDETTATQLQEMLASHGVYVSLSTILRSRKQLGWVYRGSAYCQLRNCEPNKQKRLEFAQVNLHYLFDTVIFTDETTVQLESHRPYCYQKTGEKPRLKPRPKIPNIQQKSNCGRELLKADLREYAYLKVQWILN